MLSLAVINLYKILISHIHIQTKIIIHYVLLIFISTNIKLLRITHFSEGTKWLS